jgi:hypothetical protein
MIHSQHVPAKRTLNQAIQEKMKVLKEFYVVNGDNEDKIKQRLINAVNAEPTKDFDIVLDRVAQTLIKEKLDSVR